MSSFVFVFVFAVKKKKTYSGSSFSTTENETLVIELTVKLKHRGQWNLLFTAEKKEQHWFGAKSEGLRITSPYVEFWRPGDGQSRGYKLPMVPLHWPFIQVLKKDKLWTSSVFFISWPRKSLMIKFCLLNEHGRINILISLKPTYLKSMPKFFINLIVLNQMNIFKPINVMYGKNLVLSLGIAWC